MRRNIVWWVAVLAMSTRVVSAEPLSRELVVVGVVTVVTGAGMFAGGGDEYRVFDHTVCVSATGRSITDGHCAEATEGMKTAGKWLLGAGLGMIGLGFLPKHVAVAPMIGPHIKGVAGRVRW